MYIRSVTLLTAFYFTSAVTLLGQGASATLTPLTEQAPFVVDVGTLNDSVAVTLQIKRLPSIDWSDSVRANANGRSFTLPLLDSTLDVRAIAVSGSSSNPITALGYQRLRHPMAVASPDRGTVLIVVDAEASLALALEVDTLRNDLRAEGFATAIQLVPASSDPKDAPAVRALIRQTWLRTDIPPLRHVILLGAVPVPYSGGFSVNGALPNPDFHPEHGGAWPADAYYADMELSNGIDAAESWTDVSVNISDAATANRIENRNVPGDGKFDQGRIPSDVELAVGRIDMRKLYALGVSSASRTQELALLKRYLWRNHRYRSESPRYDVLAGVDDNFGLFERTIEGFRFTEAFAASGWRSWLGILNSAASIRPVDFVRDGAVGDKPILDSASALFAYGCGPGGYSHCDFVASVPLLRESRLLATFVLLFGSYFGDSDSEDNLMRSLLATEGTTLAVGWSGRPHWFLHPMGADATIGECQMLTQNNAGTFIGATVVDTRSGTLNPVRLGERGTFIQLIGDPTLRAPSGVAITATVVQQSNLSVIVDASTDTDSAIVIVDQAISPDGRWTRLAAIDATNGFATAELTPLPTTRHIRVRAQSISARTADAPFARIVSRGHITEITPLSVVDKQHITEEDCRVEWYDILGRRSATTPNAGVWLRRCGTETRIVTF